MTVDLAIAIHATDALFYQSRDLSPLVENAALFLLCVFATRLGTGVFGNPDGDGDAGGPKSGGSE